MFWLGQESTLCLPNLAKLGCNGKILKPQNSQPIKILIKTSACLAVQLSRFALVPSLIFASCCAGTGLLKYDGCSDRRWGGGVGYHVRVFVFSVFLHFVLSYSLYLYLGS